MNIKYLKGAFASLILCISSLANAGLISYELEDIATFSNYRDYNVAQTFTGNGFVGMYGNSFAHLFRLENDQNQAQNNIQIDISGLLGNSINSAYLSFRLMTSVDGPTNFNIDGYNSDGRLRHLQGFNDSQYGRSSYVTDGTTAIQSFDITSILNTALSSNETWLGLNVYRTSGDSQWTYTPTTGDARDSAMLRLNVDYNTTEVPEPSTLAIFALGMIGLASRRFKKQS
ncbi:PEP-CTERM sorting domain-containing protein [Colwellia sp. BRX8-7]|jgi:hypothetical protein|uniref:PEP-CTERM sorting domain-containing protein n=1 Tax=Colwellia sp. BRX8-7 TaxID=2759833 RepID=UPI002175409A|nr:PEP-CTERM sorting domain-containing protein [Colwellia sp. BRX8-7]